MAEDEIHTSAWRARLQLSATVSAQTSEFQAPLDEPAAPAPQPPAQQQANPFPAVNPKNFTAAIADARRGEQLSEGAVGLRSEPPVAGGGNCEDAGARRGEGCGAGCRQARARQDLTAGVLHDAGREARDRRQRDGLRREAVCRCAEDAGGPRRRAGQRERRTRTCCLSSLRTCNASAARRRRTRWTACSRTSRRRASSSRTLRSPTIRTAERAALDGVCVRKAKGDDAFFSYARAVYAKQAGLTAQSAEETLNAAIKAAGA